MTTFADRQYPRRLPPDGAADHGGDLAGAAARFGIAAPQWLDLSTGINPVPYPLPPLPQDLWTRLPQRDLEEDLLAAAAGCYGTGDPARLVAAPGTQALIQWLPTLFPPGPVAVLGPTYAEHAAVWTAMGHAVRTVGRLDERGDAPVCVLVNPNNPDGRTVGRDALLACAADLAARGGALVIDEAFADPTPAVSLAPEGGRPGLILLRSFGKFFGLAGLRLGIAIADRDTARALRRRLGPWPVAGPALEIGRRALRDAAWIAATRRRLEAEAGRLDRLLDSTGLTVVGGTPLFRLIEAPAAALFEHLARRGILTRSFAGRPDRLRFGLPDEAGFARLAAALEAFRHPEGRLVSHSPQP